MSAPPPPRGPRDPAQATTTSSTSAQQQPTRGGSGGSTLESTGDVSCSPTGSETDDLRASLLPYATPVEVSGGPPGQYGVIRSIIRRNDSSESEGGLAPPNRSRAHSQTSGKSVASTPNSTASVTRPLLGGSYQQNVGAASGGLARRATAASAAASVARDIRNASNRPDLPPPITPDSASTARAPATGSSIASSTTLMVPGTQRAQQMQTLQTASSGAQEKQPPPLSPQQQQLKAQHLQYQQHYLKQQQSNLQVPSSLSSSSSSHTGTGTGQPAHSSPLVRGHRSGPSITMPPLWWSSMLQGQPDDDDYLHELDPVKDKHIVSGFQRGHIFTRRGMLNLGALIILCLALIGLFAGYPVSVFLVRHLSTYGGFGLGGSNATGQIPLFDGFPGLIDPTTPKDAYNRVSAVTKKKLKLVFSDEFTTDGRSFYPGDDPFWEAANLWYWVTGNYEWYDPAAVTTSGGNLQLELSETPLHNLNFRGGMISSWNKFCFTGGLLEVRAVLPGSKDIPGLWPAVWTLGNLGRAGYAATTDGTWPYSYNTCDIGTLHNQTWVNGTGPDAALHSGSYPETWGGTLSYLPGQRLSRCTCPDEDHPGPKNPDGSFVGRSCPEIDILEGGSTNERERGHVSMSLQTAPFDAAFELPDGSALHMDPERSKPNGYKGGVWQQAISTLGYVDSENFERGGKVPQTFAFEYKPGGASDGGFVRWTIGGEPVARMDAKAMGPNPLSQVGERLVPYEPMYIIANLGISAGFAWIDWTKMDFPYKFEIDYIRVYQPEDEINIGCDPPGAPTHDYIERHWEAYNNPNLTTWTEPPERGGYAHKFPKNRLKERC